MHKTKDYYEMPDMPHCYYNQCFLDKMKAEAENAEKASVECERLAAILQNYEEISIHGADNVRKMMAAANTATAAAVNVVCIARLYDMDVIGNAELVKRAVCALSQTAGIAQSVKATAASALAAAKKAEAITFQCIKNTGAPVKCDAVWLETSPPLPQLPTFAICLIAFCTMLSLQFAVCCI
jgi:hypothetical protein